MSDISERDLAKRLREKAVNVEAAIGSMSLDVMLLDYAGVVAELALRASLQPGTYMDMTRAVDRIIAAAKAGE